VASFNTTVRQIMTDMFQWPKSLS